MISRKAQQLEIKVANDPTILVRVIQVVKRRRININKLIAYDESLEDAHISLYIAATDEQTFLLKGQLKKLLDVVEVLQK